ncbi:uncharacterized protein LOC106874992 [Octopus bimaculoides]|uniref:Alpha-type protein kinase domain-containing protein n=1 Tax=Octopus bimaculoides TaxID=37653 RepID=A0A0L8GSZ8_OCTBM|nr:uncharacterized protein LOC106874992 [Octopus bimaculoides]|eukprot:XP_014778417.1 PREDICTED: uncharacterized protein LOC106874992 isoform X2 [Octopus bimaculoides]
MALKLYNKTLLSTPDRDQNVYWADFEYSNFSEGKRKFIFLGVLNGKGPRKGELCSIKTFKDRIGDYEDWRKEITKCKQANDLAQQFNLCSADERKIFFEVPIIAEMDMLSHCTQLIQKVTRKKIFVLEECIAIEPFLKGSFQKFSSTYSPYYTCNGGGDGANITAPTANYNGTGYGKHAKGKGASTTNTYANNLAFAEAFSHYTYWYTKGRMVVDDLQGVIQDANHFRLTDPSIHSVKLSYGPTDNGQNGITAFLSKHRCNKICANWFLNQQH